MSPFSPTVLAEGTFWMPPAASSIASEVDDLYYFILWLCVVFFFLVVGAMAYFVVKYRRRSDDQRTIPLAGSRRLEIIWSVIPSVILLFLFVWGVQVWIKQSVPPQNAMEVRVTGQKWIWSFDYPRQGCVGVSEMVVPENRAVKLIVNATDVLHSFYVPAFRIKRDAVPNKYNVAWFEAIEKGEYPVYCAEYCGDDHSRMDSVVRVVTQEEFDDWVSKDCGAPVDGPGLYDKKGCKACHSVDGSRLVGPSFKGLYGANREFADGSSVVADDNYIRESIMYPNAKVVAGYDPVMPSYKGQLSDEQVNAIIDYIKTLSE